MTTSADASPSGSIAQAAQPFTLPTVGEQITSPLTGATYTIGAAMGEGGFGLVFDCTDVWGNELVAKVIKPSGNDFETTEADAKSELDALAHVRHPNIVFVHDAFVFKGACYIISEKCHLTLAQLISDNSYNPATWFKPIARCLLQAVHFVHVQGMAHCDIHPKNIMTRLIPDEIDPDNHSAATFKLGDFGLAKPFDRVDPNGKFLRAIRPPEAIDPVQFGPADNRVDIYHAGLVLLQVAEWQLIQFNTEEILSGVPRDRALALPSPLSFALEKMLRRRVMYRTATALEAWRDLNSAA